MKTKWPAFGFSCLLLAGAAVAISPASAQVAHQSSVNAGAAAATISSVEIAQPGETTTVRISGSGDLHYQTSRLDSPPRLVLDFSATALTVEKSKVRRNTFPGDPPALEPPSGPKYIHVGCVIRISPLRNKVSHAVSAETASAKNATISANNEIVELNTSVMELHFSKMQNAPTQQLIQMLRFP